MRPSLLRLVTAAALLVATAGCVSVSDSRSGPDPIPAHDGRTLAPDRPAPLRLPAPGRSRERMAVA
ncbi:hypothetical protein, partial [Streptomyces lydicus]|uniref:hypothetical protein n=1 Tax=Streptomyces lydicus TaxID=47763 RepID=UPI00331AAEA0